MTVLSFFYVNIVPRQCRGYCAQTFRDIMAVLGNSARTLSFGFAFFNGIRVRGWYITIYLELLRVK